MTIAPQDFITNLAVGENGFLQAADASDVSYPEDGHDICHAVENTSFWFGHRNRALRAVMQAFPPAEDRPFVDVGGGNGFVALMVQELGHHVVMIEPGEAGARFARDRGVADIVQSSIVDLDVTPNSVGGIGLFDVLEHIDHDVDALRRMGEMLTDDGRIYLTVPAHRALWSSIDVQAGHFRRYTRRTLSRTLELAGLDVDFVSYYFWPLPAPMFLLRCLPERLKLRKGESRAARVSREHEQDNRLVERALSYELRRFSAGRSIPIGASCVAVARKRTS
ncbi:MAG: class I SAM-dependent methyltransferase [Nocardioides sp.]|uniref:class I SAM-dependent methyltransferase n=1 Tax=Nocardioides sp. TaxID=35761 RepID=UPI003D6C2E35